MSSIKLVMLGFLRHSVGILGAWLVARGYLSAEEQAPWMGKAVEEAMGGLLMLGAYVWSGIDKKFVIDWIRKALHMTPPSHVTTEKAVAKKISNLVTSPGSTPLPLILLGVVAITATVAMTSCTLLSEPIWDWGKSGHAQDTATIYRSADRARTVLTATQTLRYHSAELIAKAYVQGRLSKEGAKKYQAIDDRFRAAWESASELVTLWSNSKGAAPPKLQERMAHVEDLAAQIDAESRKVE
jgi:hypothetical protein